jgi:enterochelin esterase-like enzyme
VSEFSGSAAGTALTRKRRHAARRARRRRRAGRLATAAIAVLAGVALWLAQRGIDTHGARVVRYTFVSARVHHAMPQVGVIPDGAGAAPRPLLVFLHGKGGSQESGVKAQMFLALASLGSEAPDVVFPYGGEDSYWHNRANGEWGNYVVDEVIPEAVRRMHADPRKVAIGGLSMGGFGAYALALHHPGSFCAVGGDSAALWRTGGESAEGAFDNAEDFARNDVIAAARSGGDAYRGTSLWLDVGSHDPFRSADTELADLLRTDHRSVQFHVWPGGHEPAYWDAHWSSYLTFYARALAACGRP